jgi:hypothetical protein
LIALAIICASCSSGSSSSPQQQFLDSINASNRAHNQYIPHIAGTSHDLIASGETVCMTLEARPTTVSQLELALAPMRDGQAGFVVFDALWNLCPHLVYNLK